MQKMLTYWNQQLMKCLENANTRMNREHSKTNRLQRNIKYKVNEQITKYSNRCIHYKTVECLKI